MDWNRYGEHMQEYSEAVGRVVVAMSELADGTASYEELTGTGPGKVIMDELARLHSTIADLLEENDNLKWKVQLHAGQALEALDGESDLASRMARQSLGRIKREAA